MYDFTHPISDALEGITHSICTLEFEDHRPLYDWVLENVSVPCRPQQIEFARLTLSYTITSKRKLLRLIEEGYVAGWDESPGYRLWQELGAAGLLLKPSGISVRAGGGCQEKQCCRYSHA